MKFLIDFFIYYLWSMYNHYMQLCTLLVNNCSNAVYASESYLFYRNKYNTVFLIYCTAKFLWNLASTIAAKY